MLGVRYADTDLREITDATVTYPALGTVLNGAKRLRTSDDFTYVASTGTLTVPIINAGAHGPITCTTLHATEAATLDSTLDVSGATTITDTLTVQGNYATSLGGALGVTGNTSLSGTLGVGGAPGGGYTARVTGTLGVTGATTVNGLTSNGLTYCAAGLDVSGTTTIAETLSVWGASTFAGGKFSGNVGVGGSTTNDFPVDMGASPTVQKLALLNNRFVFYGFGVGNNCITASAGAAAGSSAIGGLVFTDNNQLGINTGLNQADIGYNLLVGGTMAISGASTLTGAVTCAAGITSPGYTTNYTTPPTLTARQIGYKYTGGPGPATITGPTVTLSSISGVTSGVYIASFNVGIAPNSEPLSFWSIKLYVNNVLQGSEVFSYNHQTYSNCMATMPVVVQYTAAGYPVRIDGYGNGFANPGTASIFTNNLTLTRVA